MFAIHPKEDCPHVEEHVNASVATNLSVSKPCGQCQDTSENWICCKCGEIGCSRFKKSHMAEHNTTTQHNISASFSDFSFWCYACDSYIKDPLLIPILNAMRDSKFPKEDKEAAGSVTESLANLNLNTTPTRKPLPPTPDVPPAPVSPLSSLDIEGIAKYIQTKAKKIIVMTGAGVSVAAGIPDFRTPGTGLYYNLAKYNLPEPTAVFDIEYFVEKPEAFFMLAKELYPGNFVPTHVHYFIRLLHEKGLLLRNYTQNIDTLERIANIPPEKLVEAHGSFGAAHCVDCKSEYDSEFVKDAVFADEIPRCAACNGLVKPDIVFFGESLPTRFFTSLQQDFPECDLLIVIGTSLQVQPFASLVKKVSVSTPRLLINMEEVGTASIMDIIMPQVSKGFAFNHANNYRDVKLLGECQAGVKKLAELLGWGQELEDLYERESKIILANAPNKATAAASKAANDSFRADALTTATATTDDVIAPVNPTTSEPAQSTATPAQHTDAPAQTTTEPASTPTTAPAQTTTEPAQTTTASASSTTTPTPAAAPAPATTTPTQPAQPKDEPAQSTSEPAQPSTTPAQSTTQPAQQHSS